MGLVSLKNKGVIFSIIFILCAGIFVTNYTRRLVSSGTAVEASEADQKSAASAAGSPERSALQLAPGAAEGGLARAARQKSVENGTENLPEQELQPEAEAAMEDQAAPALLSAEDGMPTGDSVLSAPVADLQENYGRNKEKSIGESAVISPLTGSVETSEKNASTSAFSSEDYRKKLQDIDEQIKKMKDSGMEPNTDSYRNMADYEYRLWDKELNTIYQDILSRMSTEEADKLRAEEREWMSLRDQTAHKAISKYYGGTMESLEYTASMADSTRTRAFELLDNYGKYFDFFLIEKADIVE